MNKFYILGTITDHGGEDFTALAPLSDTECFGNLGGAQREILHLEENDCICDNEEIAVFEVTKVYVHRYPRKTQKIWMGLED